LAPVAIILAANIKRWPWLRWGFLLILAFALIQTGHKMPLVMMAIFVFLSRFLIKQRLMLSPRVYGLGAIILLLVVFGALPAMYMLTGEKTYSVALYWSWVRVFLEPARGLQLYFEVYPKYHEFLHGMSTGTIASLVGVEAFTPPSIYIPRDILRSEKFTSYPALFIGEAWADFGFAGVIVFSILAAFILQLYNVWYFSRTRPRLEETALLLAIAMGTKHLLESNLLTALLTFGLLLNALVYGFVQFLERLVDAYRTVCARRKAPI
jgi:hypothetical protein